MTVLEHIKQLIVGLTEREREDLAGHLATHDSQGKKPDSLRGDWSNGFPEGAELDDDLKEIRTKWQTEWHSGEFSG